MARHRGDGHLLRRCTELGGRRPPPVTFGAARGAAAAPASRCRPCRPPHRTGRPGQRRRRRAAPGVPRPRRTDPAPGSYAGRRPAWARCCGAASARAACCPSSPPEQDTNSTMTPSSTAPSTTARRRQYTAEGRGPTVVRMMGPPYPRDHPAPPRRAEDATPARLLIVRDRPCAGRSACAPATRSRNSRPAQWSISCCSARASKASVVSCTASPVPGQHRLDHDPAGAFHVTGQVGHRHAALPARPPPARLHHPGVAQHERAVRRRRLRMLGHVHHEDLGAHPDLRRGQADTARRDPHGGDQVGGELHDRRVGRVDLGAGPAQHRVGRGDHRQHPAVDARAAPASSRRERRSQDVRLGAAQGHLDAEVGGGLPPAGRPARRPHPAAGPPRRPARRAGRSAGW